MVAKKRQRRRVARKVKNAGILSSVGMVLIALLSAAALLWVVFTRLLRDAWPWQEGGLETANPTPGFQTTQLVLTLVGGIGAAILVVVAYRRQRDLELARFDDRFAAAATQLGAPTAAERLAGVYAMAALADTWEQHCQQCIDVLCAYLRLPYDPSSGLLKTVEAERTWFVNDRPERKEKRIYEQLPNDREVRLTIISTITSHLRDNAPLSWQGRRFDFTGATFDDGDFSEANFTDGPVTFIGARFSGGTVTFRSARFSGGTVTFGEAEFSGGLIDFHFAEFSGSLVDFGGAKFFPGGLVDFHLAKFSGGRVTFLNARFSGGRVTFQDAEFSGGRVTFQDAEVSGGLVDFHFAKFSGGEVVTFSSAKFFPGGRVDFHGAEFSGGEVTWGGEPFRGYPPPTDCQAPIAGL